MKWNLKWFNVWGDSKADTKIHLCPRFCLSAVHFGYVNLPTEKRLARNLSASES